MFSWVMLAITKFISTNKFLSFFDRKEASHSFTKLTEAARKRYFEKKRYPETFTYFSKTTFEGVHYLVKMLAEKLQCY